MTVAVGVGRAIAGCCRASAEPPLRTYDTIAECQTGGIDVRSKLLQTSDIRCSSVDREHMNSRCDPQSQASRSVARRRRRSDSMSTAVVSAAAERGELTGRRVAGAAEAAAAGSPGLNAAGSSTCGGREGRLAQRRRRDVLSAGEVGGECHRPRVAGSGRPPRFAVR